MKDDIWERKEYLLFDLDGTLTDPKVGITTCVQYALKDFGIDEPDLDKLEPFIGPPLKDSFMQFYGMTSGQADRAVEKYRERFQSVGLFENQVYRGIPQMLKKLKYRGLHMGIASSKPTVYVEKILEYFRIREYFEVVVGSELDGRRTEKSEVVGEALRRLFSGGRVEKNKVFMIGDRRFDVEGARAIGIESVGVTYGYGGMEELMGAHADYIVRSVEELRRFLLRGYEDMEKDLNGIQKIWVMFLSFFVFVASKWMAQTFCLAAAQQWGWEKTNELKIAFTGVEYLVGGLVIFRSAGKSIRRTIRDMYLTHLKYEPRSAYAIAALSVFGLSLGVSMLLGLTGISGSFVGSQAAEQSRTGAAFLLSLLVFGLISPLAEELLFRGELYGYLRGFYDVRTAIVISAIAFGVYHGNMVQLLYAVSMGYLIAYLYEYFGSFRVPVLAHAGMNLLALAVSYTGLGNTAFYSLPVCLICLILGFGAVALLAKRKKLT